MTTKRFVKLQIIIVLMFTFTLICNTFSWAIRPEVKGGAFMSDDEYWTAIELVTPAGGYFINGNECSAVTYRAKRDAETGEVIFNRGKVEYDETKPLDLEGDNSIVIDSFDTDNALYFKTVITNPPSGVMTNSSLFIDIQIHNDIGDSVFVGITTPVTKTTGISTTYAEYAQGTTDMKYVKWQPVLAGIEVGPESTRSIEWSIFKGKTDKTGKIVLEDIHFTNN